MSSSSSSSSSSLSSPLLGTPYILAQSMSTSSQTRLTQITPSLCSNLSAFKLLLRSSRALDDSIALRLNRASALHRSFSNPDGDSCDSFWNELTTRWNERTRVLAFCDRVHLAQTGSPIPTADPTRIEHGLDRDRFTNQGRGETEVEVKRRQLRTETNVEAIIRARSLDLFVSRCPYHPQQPVPIPLPDYTTDNSSGLGDAVARRGRDGRGGVNWNG